MKEGETQLGGTGVQEKPAEIKKRPVLVPFLKDGFEKFREGVIGKEKEVIAKTEEKLAFTEGMYGKDSQEAQVIRTRRAHLRDELAKGEREIYG